MRTWAYRRQAHTRDLLYVATARAKSHDPVERLLLLHGCVTPIFSFAFALRVYDNTAIIAT